MAYRSGFPFGPGGAPGMFSLRREIDRLFEDAFGTQGGTQGGAQGSTGARTGQSYTPAADARDEEREITLHMDLPGVRPEDVDISVENGLLTVRGQRHQQRKEGQEGRYHFVERSYGSFSRAFTLPQGVDESQIRADFEHGELIIHVPKPALPQPRKVQIGAGNVGGNASSASSSTSASGATAQAAMGQGATAQRASSQTGAGADTSAQGVSGQGLGDVSGSGTQR